MTYKKKCNFFGVCIGGPKNGQRVRASAPTFKILPNPNLVDLNNNDPVKAEIYTWEILHFGVKIPYWRHESLDNHEEALESFFVLENETEDA